MKAVFIAYNQAHEDDVLTAMRELDIKGIKIIYYVQF